MYCVMRQISGGRGRMWNDCGAVQGTGVCEKNHCGNCKENDEEMWLSILGDRDSSSENEIKLRIN